MRIDGNGAQPLSPAASSASQTATGVNGHAAQQTASGAVLGEDQADFSGSQGEVQALTAQALRFPEIRQGKVNALRQVVENGSYQTSSGQVADAMLAQMLVVSAA